VGVGWESLARTPTHPWSVWKFNWLVNHKIMAALRRVRTSARGVLLDVGCGTRAFAPVFEGRVERYLGIDLPSSRFLADTRPDVYGRAEELPFRSGSVDTVFGMSMTTYLPEPGRMLAEAHRILKPGGSLILEFAQMAPLHDEPHDYYRFTRYGAAWLLERAGFEPCEFVPVGGLWTRVGVSWIVALNRLNRGPTRILTELPVRALYIVLQVGFELLDRVFHDPRDVLSHVVVARRAAASRSSAEPLV
jgi:SAM-dependent methyltransferase